MKKALVNKEGAVETWEHRNRIFTIRYMEGADWPYQVFESDYHGSFAEIYRESYLSLESARFGIRLDCGGGRKIAEVEDVSAV